MEKGSKCTMKMDDGLGKGASGACGKKCAPRGGGGGAIIGTDPNSIGRRLGVRAPGKLASSGPVLELQSGYCKRALYGLDFLAAAAKLKVDKEYRGGVSLPRRDHVRRSGRRLSAGAIRWRPAD